MERLILLPFVSVMPRQFCTPFSIRAEVGMVVTVLSKFLIFTVFNETSSISPSTFNLLIVIQSPTLTMS